MFGELADPRVFLPCLLLTVVYIWALVAPLLEDHEACQKEEQDHDHQA